jgi:hypothetical protein
MAMLQLDPMIPVDTAGGPGQAFLVIDYSQEHFVLFGVALDRPWKTACCGEVWFFPNSEVRFQANRSMGRTP